MSNRQRPRATQSGSALSAAIVNDDVPRDTKSLTSLQQCSILVSDSSRPTSHPRHPRTRAIPPPSLPSHLQQHPIHPTSPPSPPQIRPVPLFPQPHSAPHHLTHFAPSETSSPPDIDRYSISTVNPADRYLRSNDKYSHNQHPMLDQRRMSEPAMYGSAASRYPPNTADLSSARYHQISYVSPPSYTVYPSPLLRSSLSHPPSDTWKQDHQLPLHHFNSIEPEEPLSPLNPTFSGGESSSPLGMSEVMFGSLHEDYGPSPPGTGTSTSSNTPTTHPTPSPMVGPSSPSHARQYSFVPLPGNGVKKRPRRRYDEIERLYHCSWEGCTKAYGTLNHLNAHITMQKHGPKRSPNEFKELRKQWRKAKKEEAEAKALDAVRHGPHQHPHLPQHHPSRHSASDGDYQSHNIRPPLDYAHHPERPIQPIGPLDDLYDSRHRPSRYDPFVSPYPQQSGIAYPHPHAHGANTSGIPINRLPANSTLLTPLPDYDSPSMCGNPDIDTYNSYNIHRSNSRSRSGHGSPERHADRGRPRISHNWPTS